MSDRVGYGPPASELPGIKTLVVPEPKKNERGVDREKEQALPPGSAHPNGAKSEHGGGGGGGSSSGRGESVRDLPEMYYNSPDGSSTTMKERQRTQTQEGEEYGNPTKFDYGSPSRGLPTAGVQKPFPAKRQKRQPTEERRKDHRWYMQNRSRLLSEKRRWWTSKGSHDPAVLRDRERRNDSTNEKRYKRRRASGDLAFLLGEEREYLWIDDISVDGFVAYTTEQGDEDELPLWEFIAATVPVGEQDAEGFMALVEELVESAPEPDEGMSKAALGGYKKTKGPKKKWRGMQRSKGKNYEKKRGRSNKRREYSRRWAKKRRSQGGFKAEQRRRRKNPSRWKKRGEVLTAPQVYFLYGPKKDDVGVLRSVSPLTGMVTFVTQKKDADPIMSVPAVVFLESILPFSEADEQALFDLLEIELGPDFYDTLVLTADDVRACAKLHGRNPDSKYFRSKCLELTGVAGIDDMEDEDRALVNSVLITKMEGPGIERDTEGVFEDEGDDDEEDPDDDALHFGEVDLSEAQERELQARLVSRHRARLAGEVILYDQEGPKKEIDDPDGLRSDPSSPSHWQRTPDRERGSPPQDDIPGDDASQGADPSSARVAPGGEGQFVYENGFRAARSEWETLASHTVNAKSFNVPVGGAIWYGKYKNKRGIVKEFKKGDKGDVIVVVEQVPNETGLKKPKEMKLFKIRPRVEEPKEDKKASRPRKAANYGRQAEAFHTWEQEVGAPKEAGGRDRNVAVALGEAVSWDAYERGMIEAAVGLPLLGAGSERVVFDLGRHVLKVAHGSMARTGANKLEAELWEYSARHPKLRELLVPVVAADPSGDWLVMAKARTVSSGGDVPTDLPVKLYDNKPENWGVHDGKLKLLDYSLWSKQARTAATIADLMDRTGPHIHERAAEGITAAVARSNPAKGYWLFNVKGKTSTYRVRIKGIRKGNVRSLAKAQIQVSCSCPFWRWQGPEHWGKANKFLYGRPRGTASKPVVMDPPGKHWACKHLLAAFKLAKNYHFGCEEHAEWLHGDTEVVFAEAPIEDIYEPPPLAG